MGSRKITPVFWAIAALAVAVLVALFVGGNRLMNRFDEMEREVTVLSDRADRASREAAAAAERALAAAEAKDRAEEARRQAETESLIAGERRLRAEEIAGEARQEMERIRKERAEELNRMQQALNRLVETRRTALGLVMNLPESALRFDFNSATLKPEGRELLSRIAGVLLASDGYGLEVHGHTDDVGSEAYNRQLSERRAEAVKAYLVDAGIGADTVSVRGFGKSSPLVPGTSESARAQNRRVEIALTDTRIQYSGTTGPDRELDRD
jgi:outer membrane protein OmpA-like peptidoglycan-associated protein